MEPNGGKAREWRGAHFAAPRPEDLPIFRRMIETVLAPLGVNVLVLEVNYRFAYRSHPELREQGALSREEARGLADLCRRLGIRLIPQFQCLGHQSWAKYTRPLMTKYPEFDETPQIPLDNPGIYCRSWCPLHPRVNEVVFALMDELVESFQADAFHVGMDEVFLIASEQCPRCRGKAPAELFARAVNDYHRHLAQGKHLAMLMWGDRLLDDTVMKYGEWEASRSGTAGAIDRIPRDIIQCDWHYEPRKEYPSVPYFQQKGFRVWPSSWKNREAARALIEYSRQHRTDRMLGHLCTTWAGAGMLARALLGECEAVSESAAQAAGALRACMERLGRAVGGSPVL